jgi:OmpA-OmpF porin, OOP family
MRITVLLIMILLTCTSIRAQNLVPNPSFEDTVNCPNALDQLDYCEIWFSYRNSPDYYNSCTSSPLVNIPYNQFGFQYANTGSAYIGLKTYFTSNFREFAGCQLIDSLSIGTTYFFSINVNLALGGNAPATCATNNFGILFSTIPYSKLFPAPINNYSQYNYSNFILDSMNWLKIQGSFIADSNYNYLILGNFFDG